MQIEGDSYRLKDKKKAGVLTPPRQRTTRLNDRTISSYESNSTNGQRGNFILPNRGQKGPFYVAVDNGDTDENRRSFETHMMSLREDTPADLSKTMLGAGG